MNNFIVRQARYPDDEPAMLGFIDALQAVEYKIEPNRRTDPLVASEYLAILLDRVRKRNGRIFLAESKSREPLGWAVAFEQEDEVYVVSGERRCAYIAELYVVEPARRQGVGTALIAACGQWAREQALGVIGIGALSGNKAALATYGSCGFMPYEIALRKRL